MSENCSTCKHWRKIRDEDFKCADGEVWPGPHGECHATTEFTNDSKAWINVWLGPENPEKPFENAAVEGSLITKPDFYCNKYENKRP